MNQPSVPSWAKAKKGTEGASSRFRWQKKRYLNSYLPNIYKESQK